MLNKVEETAFYAKKYLEDILSFFGLRVDVEVNIEEESIFLDVPSTHLNGFLIGNRSETLRSISSLVIAAVKQQNDQHYYIHIDIAGYKKQKNDKLSRRAQKWFKEVQQTGKDMSLEPMNAAERRLVHHLANDHGLTTESTGEGAERHIVLKPKSGELKETDTQSF